MYKERAATTKECYYLGETEMKVEISEDQNTLTVDGVEHEAKPVNCGCVGCAFDKELMCSYPRIHNSDTSFCFGFSRNTDEDIIWVERSKNARVRKRTNYEV